MYTRFPPSETRFPPSDPARRQDRSHRETRNSYGRTGGGTGAAQNLAGGLDRTSDTILPSPGKLDRHPEIHRGRLATYLVAPLSTTVWAHPVPKGRLMIAPPPADVKRSDRLHYPPLGVMPRAWTNRQSSRGRLLGHAPRGPREMATGLARSPPHRGTGP